jgi:hypothetical protein
MGQDAWESVLGQHVATRTVPSYYKIEHHGLSFPKSSVTQAEWGGQQGLQIEN